MATRFFWLPDNAYWFVSNLYVLNVPREIENIWKTLVLKVIILIRVKVWSEGVN